MPRPLPEDIMEGHPALLRRRRLRATLEKHPDREALVVRTQRRRFSYRQLWDETTRFARGFLSLGYSSTRL